MSRQTCDTPPEQLGSLLPLCPATPNCVSSLAQGRQYIRPFSIRGEAVASFAALYAVLSARKDARIIAYEDQVLQVEFRTRLGFVDDALFVLDPEQKIIQVRSAARLGYWDLGKNRRRIEQIRQRYDKAVAAAC